jgi:arabinan endo-1,5-alpha-L-arabinosidase
MPTSSLQVTGTDTARILGRRWFEWRPERLKVILPMRMLRAATGVLLIFLALEACSGASGSVESSNGGSNAQLTTAGGTSSSSGGAGPTTGGSSGSPGGSASTGGESSLGGTTATDGGAPPEGGSAAVGATSSGGAGPTSGTTGAGAATGGASITGGTRALGGTQALDGGSKSTGGTPAFGGTQALAGGSKSTGSTQVQMGGSRASGGTASTGGSASTAGTSSSCNIPLYDSANPPKALTLSGNLGTHDPSVILANGIYYQFATGNGIGAKTSTNITAWTDAPDVFSSIPSWVANSVSGVTNIWAPDISYFGAQYHLYYAVSTFGSNKSCIGHATRASMSTGAWTDHGSVICSNVGTKDDWNAIDPNVIVDDGGTPWMSFGSFWSGIKLVKLDSTGVRADTTVLSIANNSSIEGPYIIHQCGYYYLFVSFGSCCGSPWDYNIRVGRSTSVTGPYTDKAGTNMMNGGGTLLVQGNSTWTAPGHNAVLVTPSATYNIYHALDSTHANAALRVSQLVVDAQGWPISGGP